MRIVIAGGHGQIGLRLGRLLAQVVSVSGVAHQTQHLVPLLREAGVPTFALARFSETEQ